LVKGADFRKSCLICNGTFTNNASKDERPHSWQLYCVNQHLGRRELGDSLGSLTDSVLGELTRKHETNGRLDFTRREGGLLVVCGKLASLSGDTLEDVVDEGVHDGHALLADAGVGVDLLEDLVDVGRVGFDALLETLLLAVGGLGCLGSFGRCLLGGCLGHGWRWGVEDFQRMKLIIICEQIDQRHCNSTKKKARHSVF
jgi:hypothetical protein